MSWRSHASALGFLPVLGISATAALVLTTLALLLTTGRRLTRPLDSGLLVPGAWLATIPVQSLLLASKLKFELAARDDLYLAISIANAFFIGYQFLLDSAWFSHLGNWIGHLRSAPAGQSEGRGGVRRWFVGLLVLAGGLAVLHLSLMPAIPLVELLLGRSDHELTLARENSAKLLAVPSILKYVFNWNSRIFLPVLLTTAVLFRWRLTSVFIAILGMIYIVSPLEKLPSGLFLLAPIIAVAIRDGKKALSPLVMMGFLLAFIPPYAVSQAISLNSKLHPSPAVAAAPSPISPGTAGFNRLPGPIGGALDLALRRIAEGPADVNYTWFAYFPAHHDFLRGSGWEPWRVLGSGYQTPANMVGRWAYYGKQGYDVPSISAYASFVADGWSEFGLAGVAISGLLLILALTLLELTRALPGGLFCLAWYTPAMMLVAITSPQAGLPAMMFSQGVALAPLICIAYLLLSGGDPVERLGVTQEATAS